MKRPLLLLALVLFCTVAATAHNIIPAPREVTYKGDGFFTLSKIDEKVVPSMDIPPEGYTLKIKGGKAVIRAASEQGLVWGRRTLEQLKDLSGKVPQVEIRDWPSFRVRGLMIDTGRNFRPVETLKKEIDLLSFYKMNVFHWHLTDHPAWRIESKVYPQLNDPQYQRQGRDEGKYYTYDEIRDVIGYARRRGVMIIPEIDMPGHSTYFKTAFGFEMASPEGMEVLQKLLEEFFDEISAEDCPYLHIGSDEVHVDDPEGFMRFCESLVTEAGRTPICWDPGLPFSEGTVPQVWYASIGKEIEKDRWNRPYIDSYQGYMGNAEPMLNTSRYFLHTVCSVGEGSENALGGIVCMWNDVRLEDKSLLFPHNGGVNGIAAWAERSWRGGMMHPVGKETMLPAPDSDTGKELADFERRLIYHRDHQLYDWNMRWAANSSIAWRAAVPSVHGSDPDTLKWVDAYGGTVDFQALCELEGVALEPPMDAYMTTNIHADSDTVITAWISFDTPNRSDKLYDGFPPDGFWEAQGRIFLNGKEIFPETPWKYPGQFRFYRHTWWRPEEEVPFDNEQLFYMRSPQRIRLKKGWNTLELYCPKVYKASWDWTVTFIPIEEDAEGHVHEATGLKFQNSFR